MDHHQFNGDTYRDDRSYVMRVISNFTKDADGMITAALSKEPHIDGDRPVVLVNYRNIPSLPAVRVDEFPSFNEAIQYLKQVEPTCPRVSLQGCSPKPTPWQKHLEWLHGRGLQSAAEGDSPMPRWVYGADNPRETFLVSKKGR